MTTVLPEKTWTAEELGERIFAACLGAFDVQTIHIGRRLGLYAALEVRDRTSAELAEATDTDERYVREWLEQQAVAGIIDVSEPSHDDSARRYALRPGYAEVLLDRDSSWYFGPAASMVAAAGTQLPALAEAFRTGGGVPWEQFGDDMRYGQGEMNRPLFLHSLAQEWLSSDPEVDAILRRPDAHVADVGAGMGWSAIGIALAYPNVRVSGFDVDAASVEAAAGNADEADVTDRVEFHHLDAADADAGHFDLAIACECIHDMPDPVSVLRSMHRMVRGDGAVLVLDERTEDQFNAGAGDMERLLYGFSVTTCLPDGMSHQPSVGTGTVMRRSTLLEYAREAGFGDVEEIPIDHDQFRLYRLV